jgi:hypothetical protein
VKEEMASHQISFTGTLDELPKPFRVAYSERSHLTSIHFHDSHRSRVIFHSSALGICAFHAQLAESWDFG